MKKILLFVSFALFSISFLWAESITLTESKGWLESAYVKWLPLSGANSYNVYFKDANAQDSDYKKIDAMLIRKYADYFRADVVGLKAGNYIIKVVPTFDEDTEDTSKAVISASLDVKPHIREGFAFSPNSLFKTSSGAYDDNGLLRSNAKVFYVTATTANTITADIVINNKGGVETRTGIVDILGGKEKGYDTTPMVFRLVGEVKASDITGLNSSGYIQVKGKNGYAELNITIEGIGDDATANGWGILVRNAGNIEIRNLGIMNFADDGISLDTKNENIWVHNCDFFYGKQGGGDKAKGDGSLDLKENSRFITISFNHFWDSGKMSLCGMKGETTEDYASYHHNWFDHSDSRHPRVRTMTVHVYNNYYDGIAKYGVGATMGASVFVENNYFRNCKYPMLISKQGTDINNNSTGTFSGEDGGMIKAFGNYMIGQNRFVDQNFSATEFDAVVVSSRNEKVSDTYKTLKGGTTYNNFDIDASIMYSYNIETPEVAKENTIKYAGRIDGGDFKWTFDNAVDDTSYDINKGLRAAVSNYTGSVISIGFGKDAETDPNPEPDPNPGEQTDPKGNMIHNFTTDGISNSFFNITGNLSKSKGSVEYNGLTLTQCLKMESSTNVSFTITKEATLMLVFNSDFEGKVKINDVVYNPVAGILVLDLEAGTYSIKKGDTTNLFYISLRYKDNVGIKNINESTLLLYPNPVKDYLYISSEEEIKSVNVYSITGTLATQIRGNIKSIDMSNLSQGNYVVSVQTAKGLYKQIIIKN